MRKPAQLDIALSLDRHILERGSGWKEIFTQQNGRHSLWLPEPANGLCRPHLAKVAARHLEREQKFQVPRLLNHQHGLPLATRGVTDDVLTQVPQPLIFRIVDELLDPRAFEPAICDHRIKIGHEFGLVRRRKVRQAQSTQLYSLVFLAKMR